MVRLPIGLHLVLTMLADLVGFLGGALAGFGLYSLVALPADSSAGLRIAGGFGSLLVGSSLGICLCHGAVTWFVPARCPRCGGGTYFRPGTPITYHCKSCKHVHLTGMSGGMGQYRGAIREGTGKGRTP